MIQKAPGMISTPAATQRRPAGSLVRRKFSSDFLKLRKRSSPGRPKADVNYHWTPAQEEVILRHKRNALIFRELREQNFVNRSGQLPTVGQIRLQEKVHEDEDDMKMT